MKNLDPDGWVRAMGFLDPLADLGQRLVGAGIRRGGAPASSAKNLLNGPWLGHPLHPALTDIPLGAWTGAALLDLAGEQRAADLLMAAGCAAGVAAAASGIADWQDSYGHERRMGALHGILNLSALAMLTGAVALRASGRRDAGRPLGRLGLGLALGAAYFGGELVFRQGTQVNRNAFTEGPSDWTPAVLQSEVQEGVMTTCQIGGAKVVLTRVAGQVCAAGNVCPHAGGPLSEGRLEGEVVTCPWHGSKFDLRTGRVLWGPATTPIPTYEVRPGAGGMIEVRAR